MFAATGPHGSLTATLAEKAEDAAAAEPRGAGEAIPGVLTPGAAGATDPATARALEESGDRGGARETARLASQKKRLLERNGRQQVADYGSGRRRGLSYSVRIYSVSELS